MASREDPADTQASALPSRGRPRVVAAVRDLTARLGLTSFDLVAITLLTFGTAFLRLWDLGSVPLGLHGDEAWTGLDAQRILDEGWIGVYVQSALGQPTGPVYFTALVFAVLPDTTFTLRMSMAVFGIATIPLAYGAFTLMFNRNVGVFSAALLAVMTWHLHLGRTGFMVISWPFFEVATLLAMWLAFRHRNPWLFILAGAVLGLGVYSYNAYLLFMPVAFVPLVWWIFEQERPDDRADAAYATLLFATTALLCALPLMAYIAGNVDEYRIHQRVVGVAYSDEWQDGNALDRADIVWDRAREWNSGLIYGNRPDQGDGLAEFGLPPVEPIVYVLALMGLAVAAWRIGSKEYAVCLAAAAILPWGALLTVGDGLFRRSLGLAPFVAVLAAIPLAWIWDAAWQRRDRFSYIALALVASVPIYVAAQSTYDYFRVAQDTKTMRIVYPYELDAAARWLDDLPEGVHVYFYSDRWSLTYETVRFLAPGVSGEDRSYEFRPVESVPEGGALRYDVDQEGPVAFVMLDVYLADLDLVAAEHPGGRTMVSRRGDETLFVAYLLN